MKLITSAFQADAPFFIHSYGMEEISKKARWGRGCRNFCILHYVLSGEGFFNGHRVREGEGFFICPESVHEYHSSDERPWRYCWVTFGGTEAEALCKEHIRWDANGIFRFDFQAKLLRLFEIILSEPSRITSTRALGYFFLLLSFHEKRVEESGNQYVREAKRYMMLHSYRSLSVREVADAMGISDRYLYNLFIKHEGLAPKKYLNRIRLESAQTMLVHTDYSISEIAVSNGFPDVLSFSRFFSRETGISPTAYREQKSAAEK